MSAAYTSLAGDPLVDAEALADYHDFLRWIGATPRADALLDDALLRFPDSPLLHERLRGRLLWEGGPLGLERDYAERLAREEAAGAARSQLSWFAGYASLVAAEHHRRRGELDAAVAAYGRAIARYEENGALFPGGLDTCAHFIALARAGSARVALERGELGAATEALLAALQLRPDSAATPDGLNLTPLATAKMLKAKLLEAGDGARAEAVQKAMDALDPRLLEPPPSELAGSGARERRGRRGQAGTAQAQGGARPAPAGELLFDFEGPNLPGGFKPVEDGGGGEPAAWRSEDGGGGRALVVDARRAGQAYNLMLREGSVGPDLSVSVRLQAWGGEEDQGGGLVWRAKDAANYYVARWNPLEENLRVYAVVGGKRTAPFQGVTLAADPAAWHELSVSTQGAAISVRFDGQEVVALEDGTFAEAGAVGLWSKADASTRFDDLRILPAPR